MSSLSINPSAGVAGQSARTSRRRSHLSLGLSILMTAIVLAGFWQSFFGPLTRGEASRHWLLNVHGTVYTGWMVLLLTQVTLAARGHVSAHRKLGTFGIYYGWLVLAMGLVVSIAAPVLHVRAGEWTVDRAAAFLLTPLGDMVLFGAFFGAAVKWRRQPEIHKRLMLLATASLLFAAVGRMDSFISSIPLLYAIWLLPVLAAIGYEAGTRRKVHPLYLWGLLVLCMAPGRLMLETTETWLSIGRGIMRVFV